MPSTAATAITDESFSTTDSPSAADAGTDNDGADTVCHENDPIWSNSPGRAARAGALAFASTFSAAASGDNVALVRTRLGGNRSTTPSKPPT